MAPSTPTEFRKESTNSSRSWSNATSRMHVTWSGAVVHATFVGHGDGAFAAFYAEAADPIRKQHGRLHAFFDAFEMTSYDSQMRTGITDYFRHNLKQVASLEVGARSRLVAMGATVANVVLGGMIKLHNTPEDFQRALKSAKMAA